MFEQSNRKKVLCPIENEKTGKTFWLRIGSAYINRDGSTNVYLDALPSNNRLQIRDFDERDRQPRTDDSSRAKPEDNQLPF